MKKADVVLALIVLAACVLWLGGRAFLKKEGSYVEIKQDGELVGSYALGEDREVDIGSGNHLSIRDGCALMTSADCPDRICIKQGKISAMGAMITCLPNRVTVQIVGDGTADETGPDAIVY